MTTDKYCGFIALLGAPNAGKSTLMNTLVGSKLAIVTPKAQTTRDVIRGVLTEGTHQLIFFDTPGIFKGKDSFDKTMVANAWKGVKDADAAVLLIDSTKPLASLPRIILRRFAEQDKPKAIWLNKTDKVKKPELLAMIETLSAELEGVEIFMGSALENEGTQPLLDWMNRCLPEGDWLFPEDQMSDMPMRFLAAEITREKLFLRLQQELPYALKVEAESWDERADGSVAIGQCIVVERDSHKKIVLGKQGQQLKEIGTSARHALSRLMGCPVHLKLFVKVTPNWRLKDGH